MKRNILTGAIIGVAMTAVAVTASLAQGLSGDRLLDVIVVMDEGFAPGGHGANQAAAASFARGLGVNPSHTYGTALFGFAASVPQGRLNALRNDPRVAYVEFDELNSIPTPPDSAKKPPRCADDPTGPGCSGGGDETISNEDLPWGVERIGANLATNTGAGVQVYIIDTGISAAHEDLAANLGNGYAAVDCSPSKKCITAWDDDNGHGSHVAGTVGAVKNNKGVIGVAPGVTLHAVKVLNKQGMGFSSDIIDGIDWVASEAVDLGAPVVANMSIGGSGSKTGTCGDTSWSGSNAYQHAMCLAANAGVIFAVAAGNEGVDAATKRPASYDDVSMAVSATGRTADLVYDGWPNWSNWGDGEEESWTTNGSAPVAIAAPGMGILSTWKNNDYNTISGTSMASPHVAGAIALWLAANSGQSADYSAFLNARDDLLGAAEETTGGGNFTIKGGHPHDEDFLDAGSFEINP